jgi:hypothetical protein
MIRARRRDRQLAGAGVEATALAARLGSAARRDQGRPMIRAGVQLALRRAIRCSAVSPV